MTDTPDRPAEPMWKRLARTVLVVAPLVMIGVYVGVMRGTERIDRASAVTTTPDVTIEVLDADGGATALTGPLRFGENDRLRLSGGDMHRVTMETTRLPLREALEELDRRSAAEGWTLNAALTKSVARPAESAVCRAYLRDGDLRIVVLGPPVRPGEPERPVTVFEGLYRSGRGKDQP